MTTPDPSLPDFDRLLPRARAAGVFHLPHGSGAALAASAHRLGYACAVVNLSNLRDKPALLAALARALAFPTWFGHNWDALEDCLMDLSWRPAPGYVLILEHADGLRAQAEGDFLTALRVLADVSATWAEDGVPFWTFVDLSADGIPILPTLA